jgi:alpha-1,2-mannosyltransferase
LKLLVAASPIRESSRVRRWALPLLACVIGAYAAATLVYNPLTASLVSGPADSVPLADFGSFYASGEAARRGLDPYEVYPLTLDAALGRGTGAAVNLNAPISLPLFQVVSVLQPAPARLDWLLATCAAYLATVGLLMWAYPSFRGPLTLAWALALTGFIETVLLGQVYALLALVSTAAWVLLMRRRWSAAGGLIGLTVAFKPNFVVWPVLLLVAGYRRAGLVSLAAAGAIGCVPMVLYGPRVYFDWLEALRLEQVNPQVANASVDGMLARDGAPPLVAVAAGLVLLATIAVLVWRRQPDTEATSGLALLALLLGSPLAWVGYTLFLLPLIARARMTLWIVAACALLCIPRLLLQDLADASLVMRITVGGAYSVAWLILLWRIVTEL